MRVSTYILRRIFGLLLSGVVVVLSASFPASGQTEMTAVERDQRFELFANCEPMDLLLEGLPSDAAKIDLKHEAILAAAESRLRAARLFSPDAKHYLYINVNILVPAFSIDVQYHKVVYDLLSEHASLTATWSHAAVGVSRSSSYILFSLSETLDMFLLEFLRVNQEACEKR